MERRLSCIEKDYQLCVYRGNIEKALYYNQKYYEKLFTLYRKSEDSEEKFELSVELDYLVKQAVILKNIQLNQAEETA